MPDRCVRCDRGECASIERSALGPWDCTPCDGDPVDWRRRCLDGEELAARTLAYVHTHVARLRAALEAIRDTRLADIYLEHNEADPVAWMQRTAHEALEQTDA